MNLLKLGQEFLDSSNYQYDCDECYDGNCNSCIHTIRLLDIAEELIELSIKDLKS